MHKGTDPANPRKQLPVQGKIDAVLFTAWKSGNQTYRQDCNAFCLTVVAVTVDLVVRDGEVVGVVVGVEPVEDVVVHLVVDPNASLVPVGVHAVVHAVDVGPLDVAVHLDPVEHVLVGEVFAEAADLPGEPVALRVEPAEVAHGGVDDVLGTVDWEERGQAGRKNKKKWCTVSKKVVLQRNDNRLT